MEDSPEAQEKAENRITESLGGKTPLKGEADTAKPLYLDYNPPSLPEGV